MHKLTDDDFVSYCLDVVENNNHSNDSIQTLYTSLGSQSQYCPYTFGIGLYGASNTKVTLSEITLTIIKRFYISILLNLKSYIEMLEKILYTKKLFFLLPIYPKIILKNIFKQHYSSAY